jgi:lipoprotein-releasing system ATP-binding protein
MSEIIIKTENLVKNYQSGAETLRILRGISLSVNSGDTVAITGKSGSGKSTLLNILGGLDTFDSGSVNIAQKELATLSESALSAHRQDCVGFIFQFHYLLKDFNALENVMLPLLIRGVKKKIALDTARDLLNEVNMEKRFNHFPNELSGGEQQRIAVARSLVNNPLLILADEPTGNLDSDNGELVSEMLFNAA